MNIQMLMKIEVIISNIVQSLNLISPVNNLEASIIFSLLKLF